MRDAPAESPPQLLVTVLSNARPSARVRIRIASPVRNRILESAEHPAHVHMSLIDRGAYFTKEKNLSA